MNTVSVQIFEQWKCLYMVQYIPTVSYLLRRFYHLQQQHPYNKQKTLLKKEIIWKSSNVQPFHDWAHKNSSRSISFIAMTHYTNAKKVYCIWNFTYVYKLYWLIDHSTHV